MVGGPEFDLDSLHVHIPQFSLFLTPLQAPHGGLSMNPWIFLFFLSKEVHLNKSHFSAFFFLLTYLTS